MTAGATATVASPAGSAQFAGKVVLVTGGACGIGRATVELLARRGASVILSDHDAMAGEQAAGSTAGEVGSVRFVELDVTDEAGWTRTIRDIKGREGRLDGLVNNAGLVRFGSLAQTSLEDWSLLKRVMLDGLFLGVRTGAPLIAETGGGAIVNVTSIHALAGAPNQIAYAAVKAAARVFSRSAALEWAARGVRTNALLPGPTATAILDNMPTIQREALGPADEVEARFIGAVPLGRLGRSADLAECAAFLLSDAAAFMTGSDLVADGGVSA